MYPRVVGLSIFLLATCLILPGALSGQEAVPQPEAGPPAGDPAPINGVEVLARGPVHEAFASPTTEPVPTRAVPKRPPQPLEEMPPEQKPDGQVGWIGG